MKKEKVVEKVKDVSKDRIHSSDIAGKSKFADPLKVKSTNAKMEPIESANSPWNFACPDYDQRSGNFVNTGTHYGIGRKAPVGRIGNPMNEVATLPCNHIHTTMQDDDEG